MSDWNHSIIEEFRANNGVVGGPFAGATLLLLHTTGAQTGRERISPLMYQQLDDGYAVFASKAGASSNPDWYHNILANPQVSIEIGDRSLACQASVASPEERAPIWERQKAAHGGFAEYEARTEREIPVILLRPRE
ncbi:MAG: nitroreductase family deazaflavin-dependent oxidoreductase [Acidimicrobiia bacterium]|nr:nitroreductase family deazaflavin-dependent oxidoreductase [Acidimicrobiia bacterium]MDH5421600.1 nitroreductase family deazaflavin-dependent oxidoreductase [Acidimicrobiia bacterium]MDH5505081.1 nitroreductase family deazaflavin-dependent oxidoreductase [Acidimicrobiia bacterium]